MLEDPPTGKITRYP